MVRAYLPSDMVVPTTARVGFRRVLLYRDGVLAHELRSDALDQSQARTASP